METIKSTQNAKVKLIKSLANKKYRDQHGLYVAEGFNLIKDRLDSSDIKEIYVKLSRLSVYSNHLQGVNVPVFVLDDHVFDSVADTESPQGILAVVNKRAADFVAGDTVLILDGIKDPGNLGTILRTAVAFGISSAIALCCVDVYNPKTVRSSMGAIFGMQIVQTNDFLTVKSLISNYNLAYLDMKGQDICSYKRTKSIAIAVGSEAEGVSDMLKSISNISLSIPMKGKMESLNASVSVGIAMFLLTK